MSLKDFAAKKKRQIRTEGVSHAVWTAAQEVAVKSARPYARHKARPIWADEWDVCLVLDACRWDLWKEVVLPKWDAIPAVDTPRLTKSHYSVGSASVEWINETFADSHESHWKRTGYVTGNPHTARTPEFSKQFADESVYPLQGRGLPYLDEVWADQWGEGFETVPPGPMTERGFYAWNNRERYGFDKLIVHYMQPHIPFRQSDWSDGWRNTLAFGENPMHMDRKGDWEKLRDGEIDITEFWNAYKDNLLWVLEEVNRWIEETNARILITSDHGNAKGEWGFWGHPPGNPLPCLRKVPWVIVDGVGDNKMEVEVPGTPPVNAGQDPNVQERLEALGYK